VDGRDQFGDDGLCEPRDRDEFAREAIFVICNSGMRFTVAEGIFRRVVAALNIGKSAHTAFGHKGKASAIDDIWNRRGELLALFRRAADKVAFCETLPWIGPTTKFHLAKNFGVDVAERLCPFGDGSPQAEAVGRALKLREAAFACGFATRALS
jgi:hypothetical protein